LWTNDNRAKYDRDKLRYPSDLTDPEWALVAPLIPPAKHGGRDREVDVREVVNGIMYVLSTGCQWRYIPKDLPPKSTLHDCLVRWNDDNTLTAIHHALYLQCREMMQREPSPTACVIDSQSVKSAEKGGRTVDPIGYDAGKKIKGKKRHILVDTVGLVLHAIVHPADIQERDGGILLLSTLFGRFPFLRKLFADGGYQGPQFAQAIARLFPQLDVEIVKRSDAAGGFKVLPRRWVVERTFAWISKYRRTVRDYEQLPASHEAMILWAMIALMTRRLAQPTDLSDAH
jgi:transposase